MVEPIDPDNKMFHKVGLAQLNDFGSGAIPAIPYVTAVCGKVWAPTYFGGEARKERCMECFPLVRNRFDIAS